MDHSLWTLALVCLRPDKYRWLREMKAASLYSPRTSRTSFRRGGYQTRDYKAVYLIPPIKEFTEGNLLTDGTNYTPDLCVSAQSDNKQMIHSGTIQYLLRITGHQAGLL